MDPLKKLTSLLATLPKEVSELIQTLRDKSAILENDKKLLQQENAILLRNQDMLMRELKQLYERLDHD